MLDAARECGLRVPEDLSVAGFDDIPAELLHPPLTTVRQPEDRRIVLATELIVRPPHRSNRADERGLVSSSRTTARLGDAARRRGLARLRRGVSGGGFEDMAGRLA